MAASWTEALGPHTPEAVAYQLFVTIAVVEGKKLGSATQSGDRDHADRAYILDTYKECLKAVKGL